MFICEFQDISSGRYFGRTTHPDRSAAEQHAIRELRRLGEADEDIHAAVAVADYGCADTRHNGYGVRIFEE